MPDIETKFDRRYVLHEKLLALLKSLFGNDYMVEVCVSARGICISFDSYQDFR
jgi:hypothetical protein